MQHDALTGMEKCTPVVPTLLDGFTQLSLNLLLFNIILSVHCVCNDV
jgi:hypothetical protein